MRTSETIADLASALAKAQAKIEGAVKDKENPGFRGSKYADLSAVWSAIREPLTSNGLSVTQWLRTVDGGIEVETLLLHSTGQYMADVFAVPVGKHDAQGYGSAATYARRYALMAAVGIAPVDDDGHDAVDGANKDRPFTPVAKAPANPPQARQPSSPPPTNGKPSIPASANDEAAETFTVQSIETIAKKTNQEAVTAWEKDSTNHRHLERLSVKYPDKYKRIQAAIDEALLRLPSVMEAA